MTLGLYPLCHCLRLPVGGTAAHAEQLRAVLLCWALGHTARLLGAMLPAWTQGVAVMVATHGAAQNPYAASVTLSTEVRKGGPPLLLAPGWLVQPGATCLKRCKRLQGAAWTAFIQAERTTLHCTCALV